MVSKVPVFANLRITLSALPLWEALMLKFGSRKFDANLRELSNVKDFCAGFSKASNIVFELNRANCCAFVAIALNIKTPNKRCFFIR